MNSITGGNCSAICRYAAWHIFCRLFSTTFVYFFLVLPKKTIMTKLPDQVLVAYFAQIW